MPWQRLAWSSQQRTARPATRAGSGSTDRSRSDEQKAKISSLASANFAGLPRRASFDVRRPSSEPEFLFPRGKAASTAAAEDSRTAHKHLEAHSIFWNHSNLLRMNRSASQSLEAAKLRSLKLRFGEKVLDQPGISFQYLNKLKKDSSRRIH